MIPSITGFLEQDFEIKEQASKTYCMDIEGDSVRGFCDELEAMRQAVFRILNTERYQYAIYLWDYGIETLDLYGEPITYVCPELERRITEALLMDTRITSVEDFSFDTERKGIVHVTFTANTVYGPVKAEREVNV